MNVLDVFEFMVVHEQPTFINKVCVHEQNKFMNFVVQEYSWTVHECSWTVHDHLVAWPSHNIAFKAMSSTTIMEKHTYDHLIITLYCRAKPKVVYAYFTSKRILKFGCAEQDWSVWIIVCGSALYNILMIISDTLTIIILLTAWYVNIIIMIMFTGLTG